MRRRDPELGLIELWSRLRERGYTRRPESLYRIMRKLGMFPAEKPKKSYQPKPYQQMTHPGERVQVDVKVVPRRCITDPELRLYQYTAIDEYTRLRFLAAYPKQSTYSSADFLKRLQKWYARRGIKVECVQTDNGFEFTNRFSNSRKNIPTLFEETAAALGIRHKLIRPIRPGTTARWSAATGRTRRGSIIPTRSSPWRTSQTSLPLITAARTIYR